MPDSTTTLGSRIREKREAVKLTQLQLAHAIGLKGEDAGAYISRVESDKQEPRMNKLRAIASALNCELSDLAA